MRIFLEIVLMVFVLWTWMQSWSRDTYPNIFGRWLVGLFGFTPLYWVDGEGDFKDHVWTHRYDDIDAMMTRPIHPSMSVAPPWAKMHLVRMGHVKAMLDHKKDKDALLSKYRKKGAPK